MNGSEQQSKKPLEISNKKQEQIACLEHASEQGSQITFQPHM